MPHDLQKLELNCCFSPCAYFVNTFRLSTFNTALLMLNIQGKAKLLVKARKVE